jgi:subtilisin family serine protease
MKGGKIGTMRKLLLILVLMVAGCQFSQPEPREISFSLPIMVWKDQYLVKTPSARAWCDWGAEQDCQQEAMGQVFDVTPVDEYTVIRGEALSAATETEQVPYDAEADLCIVEQIPDCEPNYVWSIEQVNDPLYDQLWGLHGEHGIGIERAWAHSDGSDRDIVVAVIDSGVDCDHEDLQGVCIGQYDARTDQPTQEDENGHGTHVAGTVAAVANNGRGVAGTSRARILAIRFLNANGSGATQHAVRAIRYATDNGADIINASWGSYGYSNALYNEIKRARDNGILFVAAAGNNGVNTDGSNSHYPSGYDLDNIISVCSISEDGTKSSFSNYGSDSVDLCAPGAGIVSTKTQGGYHRLSGTSMATPHVAGVAAMVRGDGERILRTVQEKGYPVATKGRLNAEAAVTDCNRQRRKACVGKCKDDYLCTYAKQRQCRKACKAKWCPQ